MEVYQGEGWNIRKIESTRSALLYDDTAMTRKP